MPRFSVLRDGRVERSLTLLLDEVQIGRLPGTHVELPKPSVSRRHARVRREGAVFVVEDLGSVNGIRVGGERVRRRELTPGDRIGIEDYEVVFEPPEDMYQEGLRRGTDATSGAQGFGMTFLSAGGFTAPKHGGR